MPGQPGDDLLQLAEDAIARGADVIGMAGGDGSQALVASVAEQHDLPHVCVPAGTRVSRGPGVGRCIRCLRVRAGPES